MRRRDRGSLRPRGFRPTSLSLVIVSAVVIASAFRVQAAQIPAGAFLMGRDESEPPDCSPTGTCYYDDEIPAHWVELPAFEISPCEVTNAEYAAFLNDVGVTTDGDGNPYIDEDDPQIRVHRSGSTWTAEAGWENHPMREVSWYGADAYCRWAGGRLPTEREWEKAAGWDVVAQHARRWPWSDTWNCGYCGSWWCNAPYNGGPSTLPVGSFPAGVSPYGLFDMAGNVWEWTMGGYVSYPGGPMTFENYAQEVRRGGSWTNSDYNERCAVRSPQPPYITDDNLGFRVCYSGNEPPTPRIVIPQRVACNEWIEEFTTYTSITEIKDWWGTGRSFMIDAANGWLLAALKTSGTYPAGEYMAMIRRDTGTLFAAGEYVDITVRLRYERGDRDYARTSVGVAWGNNRTISPGGRGADENFGHPWILVANNSDTPNTWHEITLRQVAWGQGKFCIGFGLWGNLSDKATPPIISQHRMWVDWVKVRHSAHNTPLADLDKDGDVDTNDMNRFEACATGPGVQAAPNCTDCDFDRDRDVDQIDFAAIQRCLSGEDLPADPTCMPSPPAVAGQADFSANVAAGYCPMTVQFTDLSVVPDPWAWYWDFGDGQTDTAQNPSHTYQTPGTYTVRLTTTGSSGPVTGERLNYITALPPYVNFGANVTSGRAPLTVQFSDYSQVPGATAWHWEFGDGQTSSQRHPAHTYMASGNFTVRLTVSGPGGPVMAEKQSYIRVSSQPRVAFIIAAPADTADAGITDHLESMDLLVDVYDDDPGNRPTAAQIASSHSLVVISSTVLSANVDSEFRQQPVPVIYWESSLSINGREAIAGGPDILGNTQIDIVDNTHPITAGLPTGRIVVTNATADMSRSSGPIASGVRVLATSPTNSSHRTILVAEPGSLLLDGGVAAHKRMFLFMYDATWTQMNATGKQILTNAVNYALSP